jgi:hypothetical protein
MVAYLGRLKDEASEERRLYRERRATRACPICGTADPGNSFCPDCYQGMKAARELATKRGICSNCFTNQVAQARGRFRGTVTQCLECRDAQAIKNAEADLRKTMGI